MPNTNSSSSNSSEHLFRDFFQAWLARQKSYLNQLLFLSFSQSPDVREGDLGSLPAQVLSHYQQYYDAKSVAAGENIFLFFSPPWFSSFERSLFWITGFKPALAFNILNKSIRGDLTAQQLEKVGRLKLETAMKEKILSDEMIVIQESVVGLKWTQILRKWEKEVVEGEVNQVIDTIRDGLRNLVVKADVLRMTTIRELVEILSSAQAAKFLASIAQLQLKVRAWGLNKDAGSIASNS